MEIPTATDEPQPPADGWITLTEASKITGRHTTTVKSMVMAGSIRVLNIPGARFKYHRGDCQSVAGNIRGRITPPAVGPGLA
jgi:hypothetical protein